MLLVAFGTRPEFIKIKPVLNKLNKNEYKVLFTGQHQDLLREILLKEKFRKRKILKIKNGPNRLDSIVNSILNNDSIFRDVTKVLVQGDTTSAFAVALAAFHRKVKIFHLEAGLRSYDKENPRPEEFNRRAISCMADVHFCPTETSKQNLLSEQVPGQVIVTGNTVLDNLVEIQPEYKNHVVVTMHRRENLEIMPEWFEQIDNIAKKYAGLEFILPVHPNPVIVEHSKRLKNVTVVEAMKYEDFLNLLASCKFCITDSGGVQEESSFLKKKALVCRKNTERPEGLGSFSVLVRDPSFLEEKFNYICYNYVIKDDCPYGDGKAAEKIVRYLRM